MKPTYDELAAMLRAVDDGMANAGDTCPFEDCREVVRSYGHSFDCELGQLLARLAEPESAPE